MAQLAAGGREGRASCDMGATRVYVVSPPPSFSVMSVGRGLRGNGAFAALQLQ